MTNQQPIEEGDALIARIVSTEPPEKWAARMQELLKQERRRFNERLQEVLRELAVETITGNKRYVDVDQLIARLTSNPPSR